MQIMALTLLAIYTQREQVYETLATPVTRAQAIHLPHGPCYREAALSYPSHRLWRNTERYVASILLGQSHIGAIFPCRTVPRVALEDAAQRSHLV